MKRISKLDEYDIAAIINLKEKLRDLRSNGLPFVYRGHIVSFNEEGELIINDKRQGVRYSTADESLIKFIIDYVVVSESI